MSLEALQEQLAARKRKRNQLNAQIERLKTTKTSIEDAKWYLNNRYNQLNSKVNGQDFYGDWVGDSQRGTKTLIVDTVLSEYSRYIRTVDNRLDDVCDEITYLENEVYSMNGIIGELQTAINNWFNDLEKDYN